MEKLDEWDKLSINEKIKFNGYKGFCEGKKYSENSAFKRFHKERSIRKWVSEQKRRSKQKQNI